MMAMTIIARYVAMQQQIRHGARTRRSVQHKDVTGNTMLVPYANAATISYLDERKRKSNGVQSMFKM